MSNTDPTPKEPTPNPLIVGGSGSGDSKLTPAAKKRLIKMAAIGGVALVVIVGAVIVGMQFFAKKDTGPAASISAATAMVTLTDKGVSPMTVQLKKGQPLTLLNQDSRSHRLTADQEALPNFDTGDALESGDSYTYIVETSGTFHYYDPNDAKTYTGTVIVE